MRVIDAHHHLWDPRRREYPFLRDPSLASIRRPYDVADLRERCLAAGVEQTVLVQTVAAVSETREFLAAADDSAGLVAGVVGWVDLTGERIPDVIDALRAGQGGGFLAGVRHQAQDEPDDGWLARPDVAAGLRHIAAAGLAFDLLVLPQQLPAAVAAARGAPDGRFVLDHVAKPSLDGEDFARWRAGIRALADLPHVTCKLSGLVSLGSGSAAATVSELRPYVDEVLDSFGSERLMFGSDWPVCDAVADYVGVRGLIDELISELSAREREWILGITARETYGLQTSED